MSMENGFTNGPNKTEINPDDDLKFALLLRHLRDKQNISVRLMAENIGVGVGVIKGLEGSSGTATIPKGDDPIIEKITREYGGSREILLKALEISRRARDHSNEVRKGLRKRPSSRGSAGIFEPRSSGPTSAVSKKRNKS